MRSALTTSTFFTALRAKKPAAMSKAKRKPGQAALMSKAGQAAPRRFWTIPPRPGEMVSALMVAAIIRSSSWGWVWAASRARRAASAPRSRAVSLVHTWRVFTPTRWVIHWSEVSTIWESSSLVTTRWGRKLPVPRI